MHPLYSFLYRSRSLHCTVLVPNQADRPHEHSNRYLSYKTSSPHSHLSCGQFRSRYPSSYLAALSPNRTHPSKVYRPKKSAQSSIYCWICCMMPYSCLNSHSKRMYCQPEDPCHPNLSSPRTSVVAIHLLESRSMLPSTPSSLKKLWRNVSAWRRY